MLEVVADQKLWIWHAYFRVLGENNDLNVLYGSPLFDDELAYRDLNCPFVVNGHTYKKVYYLAKGLSSFNNLLVKSRVIHDSILDNFESFSDSIQSLEKINPVSGSLVKRIHGCLNELVSMFLMIDIFFIVSFNRGPEVNIRDSSFFMLCLLFLSNLAKKNFRDLSEILDQLPFSERKGVVKFLKVRA
ncbi:probable arabinosyltransferase ARAD1 [Tanacetum coccineum]